MKMRKSIKLSCFLIAVLVSLLSLTGCFPSLEDYEPTDTALELVGEAAFTSIYNEETGYYEETGEVIEREYCFYENLSVPLQFYTTVNGVGDFYLTASRVRKLMNDIMKLYDPKTPIDYGSLN